jgi:hypothetical protein
MLKPFQVEQQKGLAGQTDKASMGAGATNGGRRVQHRLNPLDRGWFHRFCPLTKIARAPLDPKR